MKIQDVQGSLSMDRCYENLHNYRPYFGDPVPIEHFDGSYCYCGAQRMVLHRCPCGHQHLICEPANA